MNKIICPKCGCKFKIEEEQEFKVGDIVKCYDLECYVIGEDEDNYKLLTKDVLSEELIKRLVPEEDYHIMTDVDNGYPKDVRLTDTVRPIDFENSYMNCVVLQNLREIYDNDTFDLLTYDEYHKLDCYIRKCYYWYWLKTAYKDGEYIDNITTSWFANVTNGGNGGCDVASYSSGVRPCFKIPKSDNLARLSSKGE